MMMWLPRPDPLQVSLHSRSCALRHARCCSKDGVQCRRRFGDRRASRGPLRRIVHAKRSHHLCPRDRSGGKEICRRERRRVRRVSHLPSGLALQGDLLGRCSFSWIGRTLFVLPQALRGVVNTGAILHYDQSIDIFEPLDPRGVELESRSVVLGVYRRRGGVLLRTKTTLKDRSGRTLTETTQGTFMRGLKITGDVGPPLPPRANPPTAPPDVVAAVTVSPQQALWYRLSGDYNAIHVDPEAAKAAGLERPILHGLCSLGIAAREILRHFCPEDLSSGLVSLYCRFSKAVLPGDVLEVKMWGRAASHVCSSSGGDGKDTGNDRMGSAVVTGAKGAPPAAGVNGGAAIEIAEDGRSSSNSATTCARRGHRGLAPHRVGVGGSSTRTKAARKTKERSQQQGVEEVRFEVCSPRLEGAVVVADGRAVVKRGKRLGEGVLKGEVGAPRNRSRL